VVPTNPSQFTITLYSVVPTNPSQFTITLYSSGRTTLLYDDTKYSVPFTTF